MASNAVDVTVRLLGDATSFAKSMRKAQVEASTTGQKMKVAMRQASVGAAVGLTALTGVIVKATKSYMDLGSQVAKMTKLTDISAESASALSGQWQRWGVDATAGTRALVMLSKQIDAANQGSATSVESFKRLGISLGELKTMSSADIMARVRDNMSAMGASTERTALMMKLFGRGGMTMISWLNASKGDIGEVNDLLSETGQIMSGPQLEAYKKNAKAQAMMSLQWRGFLLTVGKTMMPIMAELLAVFGKVAAVLAPLGKYLIYVAGALAGFLVVTKILTSFSIFIALMKEWAVVSKLVTASQWLLNAALTANPIGIIIVAIAALVAILVVLYKKNETFREAVNALGGVLLSIAKAVAGVVVGAFKVLGAIIQWVIKHWRGLLQAFLIASGPIGWVALYIIKNFTKVKEVLGTVWDWLKAAWKKVYEYWQDTPMGRIVGGIIDAFQNLKSRAGDIWSGILSTIGGFVNKIGGVINKAFGWAGVKVPTVNWGNNDIKIPKPVASHATGALVKRPELALIGEDGPELILPLTKPERMKKLLRDVGIQTSSQPITGMTYRGQKEPLYGGIRAYAQGGIVGAVGNLWGKVKELFGSISIPKLPDMLSGLLPAVVGAVMKKVKDVIGSGSGKRAQIVKNAVEHVGAPYVWGGTGPNGFDCSGLIYHAYGQAGVSIPRIPVYGGKVIDPSRMLPADVLLYNPGAIQEGRRVPFGHYRMYAGSGRTIESGSGGVHTDSLAANPPAQVRSFIYDRGGWLPPGTSLATNNTGRPEPVGYGATSTVNVNVVVPGGTTLIGTAQEVGTILAPHVARALGQAAARQGRRR